MTNHQRYASTQHENLKPLLDIQHLTVTLQAKRYYEISNHTKQHTKYIFSKMWLHYIQIIISKYQYKCFDHMVQAQMDFTTIKVKKSKDLPPFPHQAFLNYCTLGFHRPLSHTFEEYMNQPIFRNKHIINPNKALPWTKNLFEGITHNTVGSMRMILPANRRRCRLG